MYPTLYEINTRPWIKQFGRGASLSTIPDKYWKNLKAKGVDYVWLMGVWETSQASVPECCFHPDLVKSYDKISPDWKSQDITGSPYAIEDYTVAKFLGKPSDLLFIKNQLNRLGLKLVLDFIPNHFNAYSKLVKERPEVFLKSQRTPTPEETRLFFERNHLFFAHGKDPYFSPWSDTVQIDYFSTAAHQFMLEKLSHVAKFCDGVRCDMAMLILPDIFKKTWGFVGRENELTSDFWSSSIEQIKQKHTNFIFLAEAYWDTQWRLQQLGFDYTYDKRIIDLLKEENNPGLKEHLNGSLDYQNRCVRFIENHDEERSLATLGDEKAKASAILYTTLPGMRLHYEGQWEGHRIRYPVQVGKYFEADPCPCVVKSHLEHSDALCPCTDTFYQKLMKVVNQPVFKHGTWQLLDASSSNFIASHWQYNTEERVVVINLGRHPEQCWINLPNHALKSSITDLLNEEIKPTYAQRKEGGLTIKLPANKGCILV